MSYQVIARKWRPQTFEEVTGQELITQTLRNAIEHERLHHAYIFSGSRGVGKTTTARLLAKALNCHKSEKPNPTPCRFDADDACHSCREISESRSIDVFEFDAASHTGVDDIRDLILESININPARDRYKVFIIDEVHMLSRSSFNALLKTLEEPPPRVEFIMATTELHKLPDTIVSRCQEFKFRSIPLTKIFDRLKQIAEAEKVSISDGALKEIARSGEGSMRDAQSNFDQVISFSGEKIETENVTSALGIAGADMLITIVESISQNQAGNILNVVDELVGNGQDLQNFCRGLLSFFRDMLVVKMVGASETLLDTAILQANELKEYAEPFSESDLIRFFNSLCETERNLQDAIQPRYVLEIGLVKLVEMRRVAPIEELLAKITKLESAFSNGSFGVEQRNDDEQPAKASTFPEKKTLTAEVPPEDVPFPIDSPEILIYDDGVTTEPHVKEIDVKPEDAFDNSEFIERFNANIVDNFSLNISSVTSEELEHFDDQWLDGEYEKKLVLSGDSIDCIPNASKFFSQFTPAVHDKPEEFKQVDGVIGASEQNFSHLIPQNEDSDDDLDIPEMPEDPNEQELLQFAEKHPLVKKVMKIFRGKIIDVKKL